MKNIPKVSVIIPCYNVEKYLDRCMKTIVGQTLKDIEIILVDDKSPDGTPQICDEWAKKDSRIKVIHKSQNEGLGYARNTGLEQATGEYVAFVDSDDFVSLKMYEILYNRAVKENADIVYCNSIFYKDDTHQSIRYDVSKDTSFIGRDAVHQFLLDLVGPEPSYPHNVKYMMSVWHAVFRRQIFEEHGIKFVSERDLVSEDLVFDIDYIIHCDKVLYINEALYYYCDNGASLSRKIDKTKYSRQKIWLGAIEDRLRSIFPFEKYKLHFQRQQIHIFLNSLRKSLQVEELGITFDSVLNDPFWANLLCDYPFRKLPIKEYLFFSVLKNQFLRWLVKVYLRR